ncbi:MAG: ribosome maturation factor RimP [Parasporobacterium sp.]|nr:ribosome maturation factor RimP [Parasporobacterium sp.]
MAKQNNIEQQTESLLQPILDRHQFELVDVEYVKEGSDWYLRAYIDKEGGIAVDDCEAVSRELEKELDARDLVPGAYILEVSSPGLTRALKKEKDYIRNLGKPVEVHTYKPIEGAKEFIGDLLRYDNESVVLDIGPEETEEITIPRSNISVIKQYFVY